MLSTPPDGGGTLTSRAATRRTCTWIVRSRARRPAAPRGTMHDAIADRTRSAGIAEAAKAETYPGAGAGIMRVDRHAPGVLNPRVGRKLGIYGTENFRTSNLRQLLRGSDPAP